MRGRSTCALTAVLVYLLTGCAALRPGAPMKSDESYLVHTVRARGETLGIISRWYTGSARHWETILRHNSGTDPKNLQLGQAIRIPRTLVQRTEPLPALSSSNRARGRATPRRRPETPAGGSDASNPDGAVSPEERGGTEPPGDAGKAPEQWDKLIENLLEK